MTTIDYNFQWKYTTENANKHSMHNPMCDTSTLYDLGLFKLSTAFDIIYIEDTKWVIRSCNLKKDRQYNGQKKRGQKETL